MPGLKNTNRLFNIFFDDASLATLASFPGWKGVLEEELDKALDIDAQIFNVAVRGAQRWKNPTGELQNSFYFFTSNRLERTVTSDDPKARRRNEGFSGMTDSLGRFYANDPGAFYLDKGFSQGVGPAKRIVALAVARALGKLGAGGLSANLNKSQSSISVEG
jgi:hypothetical protein